MNGDDETMTPEYYIAGTIGIILIGLAWYTAYHMYHAKDNERLI